MDLANAFMGCKDWDSSKLHSTIHNNIPKSYSLTEKLIFVPEPKLTMEIP